MLIASKRKLKQYSGNRNITIGSHSIKQVTNKKVLGIILDEELKWREYIDAQCKKISKCIALLRRAKSFVNLETLITMYNSLVLPHIAYCSTVWSYDSCIHNNKLYKMQKRAAPEITVSSLTLPQSLTLLLTQRTMGIPRGVLLGAVESCVEKLAE
jgi:hypothetical protein